MLMEKYKGQVVCDALFFIYFSVRGIKTGIFMFYIHVIQLSICFVFLYLCSIIKGKNNWRQNVPLARMEML